MHLRLPGAAIIALTALISLAACESAEEQAQRHFETGLELLEQGDVSRALVEFRNVFKLNPKHKDARMAYAQVQMENGNIADAYAQFLRVVEQHPTELDARLELIDMAIGSKNWAEARRHVDAASELAPDNSSVRISQLAVQYAEALSQDEPLIAQNLADEAEAFLQEDPENLTALRMVIDDHLINNRLDAALPIIEEGLRVHPDVYDLHRMKLRVLVAKNDQQAVGDTVKKMVEVFPEDIRSQQILTAWYIQQGDNEGAEKFLRELANRPDASDGSHLAVVHFLRQTSGNDVARAEIDRLVETLEKPERFIALQASMDFDDGQRDEAIAKLEKLVDGVEEPDDVINDVKVLLARMLTETGNLVGARARVEEVLENDSGNVGALKMRAAWHIDEDRTGDAIFDLRTALSQAPRDASIMTLMAAAHERAGDRDLAGERYALAVEYANLAPAETLRYVSYLRKNDRDETAEAILTEALAKTPDNLPMLRAITALQIKNKNWNEVQRTIWKLRALESDEASAIANAAQAEMMLQQDRTEETVEYLENLAAGDETLGPFAALIQTHIRSGNVEEAVSKVDEQLGENPDNPVLRNLRARLHLSQDQRAEAETIYRGLLEDFPGNGNFLRILYNILQADERTDDARQLVDEQVALVGDGRNSFAARMLKAEILERDRDFEGAIEIYEKMYEQNSGNIVIANNLASMITTHRDSQESLDRAYVVARRLKGIEVPAFQDTYGWIEYRRGNYQEALTHLEPAAEGLPENPLVQLHLAKTYQALNRKEEAIQSLERAVSAAGDNPLPQIIEAKELLEELKSESVEN